jgi:hypothetical protein
LRAPQPGQSFALVGMAGAGATRVFFLRDEADGRAFTAHLGEAVRNWRLEEASDRCVLLRQARQRLNLCL